MFGFIKAEIERRRMVKEIEEAQAMPTDAAEYREVEELVKRFMALRPKATVNDFYEHFMATHDVEKYNPFLPLIIVCRLNEAKAQ